MNLTKSLAALILHFAVTNAQCGTADACVLTETCSTYTRTTPTTTTFATCVPTPTCLKVYQDCKSGGSGDICCSTYCAATKCRPTDPKWPNCREDLELCKADEECCYNNKCVEGLCRKP
ncbi:uncharacterized protein ACHE_60089S [Aspergillus chevalieri]|uniref:Uncharacterized protein n=1 Tax=Aspergillus chevalieri TaxID=182096 RepID=A0A7R7VU50_ASPCH|nr:uncharacterized protein ACHE_60089S [Aspergillus chevalieri]BCR90203.1 hypothetical protein ACHE_60089S [Aspergillus chevalieri]